MNLDPEQRPLHNIAVPFQVRDWRDVDCLDQLVRWYSRQYLRTSEWYSRISINTSQRNSAFYADTTA